MSGDDVSTLRLMLEHQQQQVAGEHRHMRETLDRIEDKVCETRHTLAGDETQPGIIERVRALEACRDSDVWWRRTVIGGLIALAGERVANYFGWH